jgi:hypothetical protein
MVKRNRSKKVSATLKIAANTVADLPATGHNRTLPIIADEIRTALTGIARATLSKTEQIISAGRGLREAKNRKDRVDDWLVWLEREFSLSDRTAEKYMKAASFVSKFELGSNLNLSASALYRLSEDSGWRGWADEDRDRITRAVLKIAEQEPLINPERMDRIIDEVIAAEEGERKAAEEAERASLFAWEAENPEEAKQKAREEAIHYAMETSKIDAEEETSDSGEPWNEKEWEKQWLADNWGAKEEAEFDKDWQRQWTLKHGTPEEKTAEQADIDAELKARRQEQAKANAENRQQKAGENARFEEELKRFFARRERKMIHSDVRTLLVKTLGMLGSEHAGERANAAKKAEELRAKLGMTWEELIVPATELEDKVAA